MLCSKHIRSICDKFFYLQWCSQLPQKRWYHSHNNSAKVIFTKKILTESSCSLLFWCIPWRSLQKFQVQVKISTILSMFPDNLSYDHDKKVVLKNFSISTGKCLCWSLLKACRFIKKRLGNGWFYISSFRSGWLNVSMMVDMLWKEFLWVFSCLLQ